MPSWILSSVLVVALVALAACLVWAVRVVSYRIDEIQPRDTPAPDAYDDSAVWEALEARKADYFALGEHVKALFQAVADGIDHVDRNEKRVRGIVLGAKRRFEASDYYDPGVDAEADTLPERDAEGGRAEELSGVPEDLGRGPSPWDVVPGLHDGGPEPS